MDRSSDPGSNRFARTRATVRRVAAGSVSCVVAAVVASFVTFLLLESSASLRRIVGATDIRYWALREKYIEDPELVFAPRERSYSGSWSSNGNRYRADDGIEAPTIHSEFSYDELGFRNDAAVPPVDVLVIGDSFVETGESNDDTLGSWIRRRSDLTSYNLGRGWYGPYQYVALLRTYAPKFRPRIALYCHFDGNDAADAREYAEWRAGGLYYDWGVGRQSLAQRFASAAEDTRRFVVRRVREEFATNGGTTDPVTRRGVPADVAMIESKDRTVPMRMGFLPKARSAKELLESDAWRAIGSQLTAFREVSERLGIEPVAVFIPTKVQVYARHLGPDSGARIRRRIERSLPYLDASREAFDSLAAAAGIRWVDLTPAFRDRADRGAILYHPFDSHWNSAGRQIAADVIVGALEGNREGALLDAANGPESTH